MSLVLPYPDLDFVPLDELTAQELNQVMSNITYLASAAQAASDALKLTVSTTDIGEGAPLAANTLYAVVTA